MNIFVGNLSFSAVPEDMRKLFEVFGNVASSIVVMEKEKKAPKSRGFGFVEMPDEQQAFAAIAALNGKEFMGRVLNVNPARAKTEDERKRELEKKRQLKAEAKAALHLQKEREKKNVFVAPVFKEPDQSRVGRRTLSYMKRRGVGRMQEEANPRRRNQDNPMRWRKKKYQPRPWEKSQDQDNPGKKSPGEVKPWKKSSGETKPWSKSSKRVQKPGFKGSKRTKRPYQ